MSERIDAVEVLWVRMQDALGDDAYVADLVLGLRDLARRVGLSGDGKVVLDFSGDTVTVEGRLGRLAAFVWEDSGWNDGAFPKAGDWTEDDDLLGTTETGTTLYRIVGPS